jgi:hypothetical protein
VRGKRLVWRHKLDACTRAIGWQRRTISRSEFDRGFSNRKLLHENAQNERGALMGAIIFYNGI